MKTQHIIICALSLAVTLTNGSCSTTKHNIKANSSEIYKEQNAIIDSLSSVATRIDSSTLTILRFDYFPSTDSNKSRIKAITLIRKEKNQRSKNILTSTKNDIKIKHDSITHNYNETSSKTPPAKNYLSVLILILTTIFISYFLLKFKIK